MDNDAVVNNGDDGGDAANQNALGKNVSKIIFAIGTRETNGIKIDSVTK